MTGILRLEVEVKKGTEEETIKIAKRIKEEFHNKVDITLWEPCGNDQLQLVERIEE